MPADVAERVLDAARLAGSARNQQPWRLVVIEDRALLEQVAAATYVPPNLLTAGLVVAVVVSGSGGLLAFDAGRAAQNLMLAAWNEGLVSCPNGLSDRDRAERLLRLRPGESVTVVISLGYPPQPRDPGRRPAKEWSRRARRQPLPEVVERL